jgi:hypothetical protein
MSSPPATHNLPASQRYSAEGLSPAREVALSMLWRYDRTRFATALSAGATFGTALSLMGTRLPHRRAASALRVNPSG